MKPIILPGSNRLTTQLGFGTSGLHGGWSRRGSLALLETAFDAGIRHFDTAPMYGLGRAEEVMGEFIARHRSEVTITTKFGLGPPRSKALFEVARGFLKPVVACFPAAKARLVRAASVVGAVGTPAASTRYSVPAMLVSLEQSLRKLRCERIDVFLVHEGEAEDIRDDLRQALEEQIRKGAIGTWGLGSARQKIDRAIAAIDTLPPVLQFEWSVRSDRLPDYRGPFVITHGAIASGVPLLRAAVAKPGRLRALFEEMGTDMTDPNWAARVLVGAAMAANPDGLVLFSSKKPLHVRTLARLDDMDRRVAEQIQLAFAHDVHGRSV